MAEALIGAARAQFHDPVVEQLITLSASLRALIVSDVLPRSVYERIVEGMISQLDLIDGDPDFEDDDPDHCAADDDDPAALYGLPEPGFGQCEDDEYDDEGGLCPNFGIDQSGPYVALRDAI